MNASLLGEAHSRDSPWNKGEPAWWALTPSLPTSARLPRPEEVMTQSRTLPSCKVTFGARGRRAFVLREPDSPRGRHRSEDRQGRTGCTPPPQWRRSQSLGKGVGGAESYVGGPLRPVSPECSLPPVPRSCRYLGMAEPGRPLPGPEAPRSNPPGPGVGAGRRLASGFAGLPHSSGYSWTRAPKAPSPQLLG